MGVDHLEFSLILFLGSIAAGFLGALSGLGGGTILVPLLILGFRIDSHYAVGASLIGVIATSLGASIPFLRKGLPNVHLGLFLETASAIGAIVGALIASYFSSSFVQILFGLTLIYTVISSYISGSKTPRYNKTIDPLGHSLQFDGLENKIPYRVKNVPLGFILMIISGNLSGMLGIGSGAFNVLALEQAMGVPLRTATTTSTFMVGVTAAASAGTFLHRGYVSPSIVMPLVPGVLIGSYLGAKLLSRTKTPILQLIFSSFALFIGLKMLYKGFSS